MTEHSTGTFRGRLAVLAEDPRFQRAIIVLIVVNAITLGLETSPAIMAAAGPAVVVNAMQSYHEQEAEHAEASHSEHAELLAEVRALRADLHRRSRRSATAAELPQRRAVGVLDAFDVSSLDARIRSQLSPMSDRGNDFTENASRSGFLQAAGLGEWSFV